MTSLVVGRGVERHRIARAVERARTVVVVGPAGIGKTSLVLDALSDRVHHVGGGLSMLRRRPTAALETASRRRLPSAPDEAANEVLACCGDGVLVVEDLHWVHDVTIDVLGLLVGRLPIVLTTRPVDDPLRQRFLERADVEEIVLSALGPSDADRLSRRFHPELSDAQRDELLRLAGGVPLLIEQLVASTTTSPTLTDAVAHRLRELSSADRRVLGALALLGRPASGTLLTSTPATDLVVQRADGDFEFRHASLAHGVVAVLSDDERADLHSWLAQAPGLDDGEAAAHHLAAGENRQCAAKAERAARCASSAVERAELLRLAAEAEGTDARWAAAAEALVAAGRWQDAIVAAGQVSDDDVLLASDAHLQRGLAKWYCGDVEDARDDLLTAEALVAAHDEERSTRVAVERAFLEVRARTPGSLALAEEAVARAEAAGVMVERARLNLGAALLYDGRPEWEPHLRDIIGRARRSGDHETEAAAAYHLISGLGFHGRAEEAVEIDLEMARRTEAVGLRTWTTHFVYASLFQRTALGVDQEEVLEAAIEQLAAKPVFRNRFQAHVARAVALLDLDRFDEARAAVADFEREVELDPNPDAVVALALVLGEQAWYEDDPDLAERALAVGRGVIDTYFGLHLLTERTTALVLLRHGRPIDPQLPSVVVPAWWAALVELDGLRAWQRGECVSAAEELQRAADDWERSGMLRWAIRTGLAACDAHPGARNGAARRRRYVNLARRAGLRGMLGRLDVAVHPELTVTEERILRRVGTGATTRTIAAELQIAPGTVDQHIDSARRKLGAATRLEAAAQLDG